MISSSNFDDPVVAAFLKAFEACSDPSLVLADYSAAHPARAAELRGLAEMNRLLEHSTAPAGPTTPERLGEFRVVRLVSRGGMGEIYEAVQERLGRRVAVKTIRQGRISPEARERFLREQRVLAQLHQTHIVPIHTAGEEGPLQYFAMPYIDGAALHHVVRAAWALETQQAGSKTPSLACLAGMVAEGPQTREAPAADSAPAEPGPGATPEKRPAPRLSAEYFRSVARVMADAADALHHAHSVDVLHRDVKPSNIMVDRAGQCWLVDFGLALVRPHAQGFAADGQSGAELGEPLTTSGIMGTPQYMAPEQFQGKADVRTDVWGLGVTLYELLTLRRAFEGTNLADIEAQVLQGKPARIRKLVPNAPADLAAITRKAMHPDPAHRYATSADFAVDLRRWLAGEPTRARPAWPPRRVWLWGKRNRGWVAALAVAVIAGLTIAILAQLGNAANQRREETLQKLALFVLSPHETGWSDKAWELGREAARVRASVDLRTPLASTLAGVDAKLVKAFTEHPSCAVVFDATGKRLLLGGADSPPGMPDHEAAIYDRETDTVTRSGLAGAGPVAFRPDGSAIQLGRKGKNSPTLLLWSMDQRRLLREYSMLQGAKEGVKLQRHLTQRFSTDGRFLAASAILDDGAGTLLIWDLASRQLLGQKPTAADVLCFSSDGKLLAAGTQKGQVTIWSLPDGKERKQIRNYPSLPVTSLAFGPQPRRHLDDDPAKETNWLLAVGDQGGQATIWDLGTAVPQATCSGNSYAVSGLSFSPDRMTLAVGDHSSARLFDVATGRQLLQAKCCYEQNGVSFSPDGRELAVWTEFFSSGRFIGIWRLEGGRGMVVLRGLKGQITKVGYSRDGRMLAALSHRWELGIWDVAARRLLHVFETTPAIFTDNAAFAFDKSNRQLAFAAGDHALLWDLGTGRKIQEWSLPPGLQDNLAFTDEGRLVSARVETKSGIEGPYLEVSPDDDPRVIRVRELVKGRSQLVWELPTFNRHVHGSLISPDGTTYVAHGLSGTRPHLARATYAWDLPTRKLLWELPWNGDVRSGGIVLTQDAGGQALGLYIAAGQEFTLLQMRSKQLIRTFPITEGEIVMPANHRYFGQAQGGKGFVLYRWNDREPLLTLEGPAALSSSELSSFAPTGSRVAWGTADGSVIVADIPEIQRRLAEIDLGW